MPEPMNHPPRIGFGYDVHQLKEDLPLVIGGVIIPHHKGAVGHSDADVLMHAVMDALLGAAGLGDIGGHFPDTDPAFRGADSKLLLRRVGEMISGEGYQIGNIDATICLQLPRISPFIPAMAGELAGTLGIDVSQVSVKATTTEGLGFVGKGDGVSAYAVALLYLRS
jgi:2-C-methyl-D-erythritol 2,4-cyclodiphosphate synthase